MGSLQPCSARLSTGAHVFEFVDAPSPKPRSAWRLQLRSRAIVLHIHGPTYRGPTWFNTSGLGVSYGRSKDGGDPYQDSEHARQLDAIRETLMGEDLSWLEGTLKRLWKTDGLKDEALRQVSMGRGRPYGIIRVGFRCNQDCAFCWQSRSWPEPSSEICKRWIDEYAQQGVTNLIFSGGEPTLYHALPELVSHASVTYGMEVGLETNAIRFAKTRYLSDLMARGMSKALISLHSADAHTSDTMTRAPGTWAATFRGTKAALSAGLLVALNCVVDRDNVDTLPAHARFIVEHFSAYAGDRLHQVIYSHPSSAWDAEHYAAKQVSLERIKPSLLSASRVLLDAGINVSTGGSCGFPPCIVAEEERLHMPSTAERFASADLSGRAYAEVCTQCGLRAKCLGVRREYMESFGARGLKAIRL